MSESNPTTTVPIESSPTHREFAEQRRTIMERVLPILELEGEEFDNAVTAFVTARIDELPKHSSTPSISMVHGGTSEFIGPETAMVASGIMTRPYYLDDPKAYEASFSYVKKYYEQFKSKLPADRAYLNAVIAGTNYGQAQYFETYAGDPAARLRAMADIIDDDVPESSSIADFKKIAVCQERAGVVHNTLLILGIDSKFETGYMSVENEDGTVDREAHAFLTATNSAGERVLFDPTNPILIKDESGNVVSIAPTHFKMNDTTGMEVDGDIKERTIVDGKQEVTRSRRVTYILQS